MAVKGIPGCPERDCSYSNVTIDDVCEKHNALARYVGIPFFVSPEKITRYPAVLEEYGVLCRGFGGYRIPLARFKGEFKEISFRGMGNGKQVVCGYVVDSDGYIESYVSMPADSDGWATLPLTPRSHALYASVPLRKGKPAWTDIKVELIYDSMRTEIVNAFGKVLDRITAIEERMPKA